MESNVKEKLASIEPGSEVLLRLADGRTISGTLRDTRDDTVNLEDASDDSAVSLDDVVDVGQRVFTEGLE